MLDVTLRDIAWMLDVPLQQDLYGGLGGDDGGIDLVSHPKPLCYGRVFNIRPVLVDAARQVYQVHNGQIKGVFWLGEGGVAMTDVSPAAPGIGEYSQDKLTGLVTLGFTPLREITCNVEGAVTEHGYLFTVGAIIKELLARASLDLSWQVDAESFNGIEHTQPATVGTFIDTPALISDTIDALASGLGLWVGPSRLGVMQIGRLDKPLATPHATLADADIISLTEAPLPPFLSPPPQQIRIGYQRNWTPLTQFAGVVTGDLLSTLQQEWRIASAFSSPIAATFLRSQRPAMAPSPLYYKADATAEAQRRLDLETVSVNGALPRILIVDTDLYVYQLELGMTVQLDYERQGLVGWRGVVVAWSESAIDQRIGLTLLG